MHLAKCLENDDWDSIRQDPENRPIKNINGKSSDEEIIKILEKYGIYRSYSNSSLKNKKTIRENSCNSWTGNMAIRKYGNTPISLYPLIPLKNLAPQR